MPTSSSLLRDELEARAETLRAAFGLSSRDDLTSEPVGRADIPDDTIRSLASFNIEWHIVPPASLVPFDATYLATMYPGRSRHFEEHGYETASVRQTLEIAHQRVQGTIVGVETTEKPGYLPGNTQFYGTTFGHDPTSDPLRSYIERAGLKSGPRFINSRFAHTPATLRSLGEVIDADWRSRGLIPAGYQLAVCPPTVFNLVGLLFHREWSQTATLELSADRDERGNAVGLAVGSNGPGDFSYVRRLESNADLSLLGFRVALVPIPR
jgi:hypothetical protein